MKRERANLGGAAGDRMEQANKKAGGTPPTIKQGFLDSTIETEPSRRSHLPQEPRSRLRAASTYPYFERPLTGYNNPVSEKET